jgi:lactate permease
MGDTARAALAAAPIALILVLMLGAGWSAARAALAALATAGLLAAWPFGFEMLPGLVGVAAEGAFLAATILWILWPALALHHMQQESGALEQLRARLGRLSGDKVLQALLVGWFVALFFEGAAGFGTPVALAAPLLVGLGLPPVRAVVLALLGHAAGVSFGALGTPVLAQVGIAGLDALALGWRTAALHLALGGILMAFFLHGLRDVHAPAGGLAGSRRSAAGWGAFAAAAFLVASLGLAALLGPELPTLGGALAGGALFGAVVHWRNRRRNGPAATPASPAAGVGRALAPYALLVILVLSTRLVPPLAERAAAVQVQWQLFQDFRGSVQPFLHPGTLLFASLLLGALVQRVPPASVIASVRVAAKRLLPVTVSLLAMLCLSRLMLHAGLVDALQVAAVRALGGAWPLLAPAVGALGSFVTGSATASNVLFTSLQVQTAQALGLPAVWLVAAQGVGAAVGNVVCPHNIIAGAATVGATGRESEILRATLLPCACFLAAAGLLVLLVLHAGS